MPTTVVENSLQCTEPGCKLRVFSTPSNLKRHKQSKHGSRVKMPCGRDQQNHKSNIRRHQKSCHGCRQALGQLLAPYGWNNLESTTDAVPNLTGMSNLGFTSTNYSQDFIDISFLMGDNMFENAGSENSF
ncbi:hypothetical protein CLIM01_11651 [Colletotrichum limetticola]|uniref:C2H2-type domain-containing protein n=1 Tax=Colletotrichum limetticola TaxID=1209924 RepID=A0ABQ9PGG4_9PEZI|nr:hypothetical protein CLIM01_11651 [Colletotrichum limetticola]